MNSRVRHRGGPGSDVPLASLAVPGMETVKSVMLGNERYREDWAMWVGWEGWEGWEGVRWVGIILDD